MTSEEFIRLMGSAKIYDLTQRLSVHTPPWPSYMPLGIQYFKRLAGAHQGQGANGQIITTSNHVGTHVDGEIHFHASGRTIGDTPLDHWYGPGVVVDIADAVEDYGLYTPEMLSKKVEIREGDILIINTGYNRYGWDHPMNTIIRNWHPRDFAVADRKMRDEYGKSWDELFPLEEYYQVMHLQLFPKGLVHAENIGGQINEVGNKRLWIGLFPLRGIEMESSMCRLIAIEP